MKGIVLAAALMYAMLSAMAHAGVAPNTGASHMSQSGARLAPSKKVDEQPKAEPDGQQQKQH